MGTCFFLSFVQNDDKHRTKIGLQTTNQKHSRHVWIFNTFEHTFFYGKNIQRTMFFGVETEDPRRTQQQQANQRKIELEQTEPDRTEVEDGDEISDVCCWTGVTTILVPCIMTCVWVKGGGGRWEGDAKGKCQKRQCSQSIPTSGVSQLDVSEGIQQHAKRRNQNKPWRVVSEMNRNYACSCATILRKRPENFRCENYFMFFY